MSKPLNIQIVERARSLIEKEEHWCFDLLSIDGARITPLPLHQRKAMLAKLVAAVGDEHLQFSGEFKRPDQAARDLSENEPRGHRFEAA